jgi:hypothetical protein
MRATLKIIKNINFNWKIKVKTNKTLTKELREKNQKNKDWIEYIYMTNCNSRTTLKMTKTFIIGPRTIIKNKKQKDWNWQI